MSEEGLCYFMFMLKSGVYESIQLEQKELVYKADF